MTLCPMGPADPRRFVVWLASSRASWVPPLAAPTTSSLVGGHRRLPHRPEKRASPRTPGSRSLRTRLVPSTGCWLPLHLGGKRELGLTIPGAGRFGRRGPRRAGRSARRGGVRRGRRARLRRRSARRWAVRDGRRRRAQQARGVRSSLRRRRRGRCAGVAVQVARVQSPAQRRCAASRREVAAPASI